MTYKPLALYFHIPFCKKKCPYCDFNAYALKHTPEKEYVECLKKELLFYSQNELWGASELSSIYFGGGTPSLFSASSLSSIIETSLSLFKSKTNLEITIEANPGDLNNEDLKDLKKIGANRLSLGVQSFNPKHLKTLGRWHSPEIAEDIFEQARAAGFDNLNLDLMFALPEQSLAELEEDIKKYIALNPEHISAYELSIEKGTNFFQRYQNIEKLHSEETRLQAFQLVKSLLTSASYEWYEISNYAKAGRNSIHNSSYWQNQNYLGLGAGAHSFFCHKNPQSKENKNFLARRFSKLAKPEEYIKEISNAKEALAWSEYLDPKQVLHEYIFTGLRTSTGLSVDKLDELLRMANSSFDEFNKKLDRFYSDGFLVLGSNNLSTSEEARLISEDLAGEVLGCL